MEDEKKTTALVKAPTKVTIDLGEFLPRIIELAHNECRTPENQVRFMFKRMLEEWDSKTKNAASLGTFTGFSFAKAKKFHDNMYFSDEEYFSRGY